VTGLPFLGAFRVLRRRRLLSLSGEMGKKLLTRNCVRILRSMGLHERPDGLVLEGKLPRLDDARTARFLAAQVRRHQADVIVLDSIYTAFAGPGSPVNLANDCDVGQRLLDLCHTCLGAGAFPVLVPTP
jgi:hypothetical protein